MNHREQLGASYETTVLGCHCDAHRAERGEQWITAAEQKIVRAVERVERVFWRVVKRAWCGR